MRNSHPPTGVDKARQIVDAFRADEKDAAESRIEIGGRLLRVRALEEQRGWSTGRRPRPQARNCSRTAVAKPSTVTSPTHGR